ncbi:MAG: polynucleotide kinase-phosphatase [Armatimonadetes bacterium]|nr:polynucleotide kinase-phosphatase [Armatimonadota bacterium]
MLLHIDTTREQATDLGYLLAKNPARCQTFALSFGRAHVFSPVGLVRGRVGSRDGGPLSQYVNDRPYVAMAMTAQGSALCVPGNHDVKLERALRGRDVRQTHGLAATMAQLASEPPELSGQVADFIGSLVSHYVLDGGRLVVAHAGLRAELHGRASSQVREFALYGETTGETDEYGLPVRYFWAGDYRSEATVVYGHTPVPDASWTNRTICIDTGCVFGGQLTALRYPERELVQVPARRCYYEPARPLHPPPDARPDAARPAADLLDIQDVLGKRIIPTRTQGHVTIREENALAALEVLGRFAADPRWLVYLPPTMAPADTCRAGDYLEHPREAFAYFRGEEVARVVCQEKHMGSRAVVVLCRDEATARRRFSVSSGERGMVLTRTGRPFFAQTALTAEVVSRLCGAVERAGLWSALETDWLCLDAELMPWSARAQELLRTQYAPAGAAARAAFAEAIGALEQAQARGAEAGNADLLARLVERQDCAARYDQAWRRYCWRVDSVDDLKIAPFHLLAGEGHVYTDRDHLWHMATLAELCAADPALLRAAPCLPVDLTDADSEAAGIAWWEQLTDRGGEGMVVKPLGWLTKGPHGLVQPAIKCRGREYLRIIYGPDYTRPDQLDRLRQRSLGTKRAMALREYALGLEALHRFVEGEPLYRVHECVLGVLAMESQPVDPRL